MQRVTHTMWWGRARWFLTAALFVCCGFVRPAYAMAEVMTYSGVVTNPDGTQVTDEQAACVRTGQPDTCDFRITLFTKESGGRAVWEDTFENVEIDDVGGAFSLDLDCGGDFFACSIDDGPDFAADELYIEVGFDPSGNADFAERETFDPRTRVAAAAYAMYARDAAMLGGAAEELFVRTDRDATFDDDTTLEVNGTLNLDGDLSIADTNIHLDGSTTNFDFAGDFSVNDDDFFVDKETGMIGIGTRAPTSTVHVDAIANRPGVFVDTVQANPLMTQTALSVRSGFAQDVVLSSVVQGDFAARFSVHADGQIAFGDGVYAADTFVRRAGAGVLATDGVLTVGERIGVGGVTNPTHVIESASGAHLSVGGVWVNASDKNLKENFIDVSGAAVLERLADIRIAQWNYKNENDAVTHIGPTAQDFFAAFGFGGSDRSIATIDASGIAMLGVQELYARDQARVSDMEDLRAALAALAEDVDEDVMEQLEELIDANDDKDDKIARLEGEVAELRTYYTALADAYALIAAGDADLAEDSGTAEPIVLGESVVFDDELEVVSQAVSDVVVIGPDAWEAVTDGTGTPVYWTYAIDVSTYDLALDTEIVISDDSTEDVLFTALELTADGELIIAADAQPEHDVTITWEVPL